MAHLVAQAVTGGCIVNDFEGVFLTPPERRFRLGIFDNAASALSACPTGCAGDSNPATVDGRTLDACGVNAGCGSWNFTDTEATKVIPNGSGAFFYFGLFDDDTPDADDLLGDHWAFASGPVGGTFSNNNAAPYSPGSATPITSMCSQPLEGAGAGGNYSATLSIFFTDTTPPSAPSSLAASDDLLLTAWDNDSTLAFQWTPGSDANSGIEAQLVDLREDGADLLINQVISGNSLTICASGCTLAATVQNGRTYSLRVTARNGDFPTLQSQTTASTAFVPISVDLVNPETAISSPASGAWLGAATSVALSDSDSPSGLQSCERRVISAGVETLPFATRSCNAPFLLSVGPAAACRHEGGSTCRLTVRSTDIARRGSGNVDRFFSVDFTADAIAILQAFTGPGGSEIAPGVPQLDTSPRLVWEAPSSTAPITGFSTAVGSAPDCSVDLIGKFQDVGPLPVGSTTFGVRAIDQAGNCGPVASFEIVVQSTPVPLLDHRGWLLLGGCLVAAALRVARRSSPLRRRL